MNDTPMRGLGDLPPLPRLRRLREDILNAPYHLCTQKASLLTRHFRAISPEPRWVRALSALHFSLYARSLERTRAGTPQRTWQVRVNNGLNALYLHRAGGSPSRVRIAYAEAFRHILENMELRVHDGELIVGNPSAQRVGAPIHPDLGGLMMLPEIEGLPRRAQNPIEVDPEQLRELREEIFPFWFHRSVLARTPLYSDDPELFNTLLEGAFYILTQFAGISHVTPDYPTILRKGFRGIREDILARREAAREELAAARKRGARAAAGVLEERVATCEAMDIVAKAAMGYGTRWSRFLAGLASDEPDAGRRAELETLGRVLERVPAEPASTFHEAVQAVFTTHVILHQESFQHGVSFGRMDQYLLPYYRRDLAAGRTTPERAAEILGCFLCKAGELLPLFFERATEYFSGLSSASGITLGGRLPDGSDGVNDLSYLFLLAYDQVRLRQPNLHVRLGGDGTDAFSRLACDVLRKGGGLPAFFNDARIVPALERLGLRPEDAADYAVVGCVEWGSPGKSFPAAGAVFVNLPMALHLALHNGRHRGRVFGPETGGPEVLTSMERILDAFGAQLDHLLRRATEGNNAIERTHARHRPTPFLSTIVDGCVEAGVEVNAGGARYNSTGCQAVGLADVVDSLAAMDLAVFHEGKVSLPALVAALDADFRGREDLRRYLHQRAPAYGQNDSRSDGYLRRVSRMFTERVTALRNPRNGRYLPGFWSMTTHQGFGQRTPALPSGRRAGEPLANGASPCNGRDRLGPTASLSSSAHIDADLVGNGYALNQKIDPSALQGPEGSRLLDGMIRAYFEQGGMQVQFNVIDPALLLHARAHPEAHPDLVVRVSGYSAYFNDLTEAVQDELIERVLHRPGAADCCT